MADGHVELDTTGQTVYAANNIFYNAAATPGDSPSPV